MPAGLGCLKEVEGDERTAQNFAPKLAFYTDSGFHEYWFEHF